MNELHLFAGAGGGILGGQLLGHRCVGAVELDPYCRRVLLARVADGCLPAFPVFEDVRDFDGRPWRGRVDVVAGGFPCQDVSNAGARAGLDGERSGLWWEMHRIIREVGPAFVFVENVPGLLVRGFDRVLGSLADLGFDAEWCELSAADCGAPHIRKRLWILAAHPERVRLRQQPGRLDGSGGSGAAVAAVDGGAGSVPDADRRRCEVERLAQPGGQQGAPGRELDGLRAERQLDDATPVADAGGAGLPVPERDELRGARRRDEWRAVAKRSWWAVEPRLDRVAHGVPDRVHRLRALGNAQVPLVAATAWRLLMARLTADAPAVTECIQRKGEGGASQGACPLPE